jgi:hypothetical protein
LTAARAIIEHYGAIDPEFSGRMRFYRWMGSVHAVLDALDNATTICLPAPSNRSRYESRPGSFPPDELDPP